MYQGVALIFIANAYGVPMPIERQLTTILVLMLLTKGIANVPSASIVTLLAAATTIGLPPEGVAILLAVDFFADMPRTATTVLGDALSAVILDRSEGTFTGRARRVGLRLGWGTHAAAEARRQRQNEGHVPAGGVPEPVLVEASGQPATFAAASNEAGEPC